MCAIGECANFARKEVGERQPSLQSVVWSVAIEPSVHNHVLAESKERIGVAVLLFSALTECANLAQKGFGGRRALRQSGRTSVSVIAWRLDVSAHKALLQETERVWG